MKVSRQQAAENRERILDVAARLFRERGFDGIGVADLMKEAGLTHGGFYGQFDSKEDLAAQACARALGVSGEKWERQTPSGSGDPLKTFVASYLSTRHRDNPGGGCAFVALGADTARRDPAIRRAFTEGLQRRLGWLTRIVRGRSEADRRRKALATLSSLVGAMLLARAVDDEKLSGEILEAVKESVQA